MFRAWAVLCLAGVCVHEEKCCDCGHHQLWPALQPGPEQPPLWAALLRPQHPAGRGELLVWSAVCLPEHTPGYGKLNLLSTLTASPGHTIPLLFLKLEPGSVFSLLLFWNIVLCIRKKRLGAVSIQFYEVVILLCSWQSIAGLLEVSKLAVAGMLHWEGVKVAVLCGSSRLPEQGGLKISWILSCHAESETPLSVQELSAVLGQRRATLQRRRVPWMWTRSRSQQWTNTTWNGNVPCWNTPRRSPGPWELLEQGRQELFRCWGCYWTAKALEPHSWVFWGVQRWTEWKDM